MVADGIGLQALSKEATAKLASKTERTRERVEFISGTFGRTASHYAVTNIVTGR
jgi:hypothetical protein